MAYVDAAAEMDVHPCLQCEALLRVHPPTHLVGFFTPSIISVAPCWLISFTFHTHSFRTYRSHLKKW